MPARRLLIAARGEIARRVLRSARRRGYRVAVVSTPADRGAPVRAEADRVLTVPDFLDAPAVIAGAAAWKASVLHPGYGFLSENPDFAAAVERAGIAFAGPTASAMRLLGGKEEARRLAVAAGVPVLPALSSTGLAAAPDPAAAVAETDIGFPCAVKAAFGGGGIGIRVVRRPEELGEAVAAASAQAEAAFGDGTVYLERWLDRPRHVEFQVFGDGEGGGIHLGERECSVQRRRQKLVEWAPAFSLGRSLRRRMGEAALALVGASRYRGAGTVEFLLDGEGSFFFLEVNTRLQVEHPVTEAVVGVDLVDGQLALAEGGWPESLPPPVSRPEAFSPLAPRGAAIEARLLAESPRKGFAPSPGTVRRFLAPAGPGVRVDSGIESGTRVPSGFDSLLAKVIAAGADLGEAAGRLVGALENTVVHGLETNLQFLAAVLRHPDFLSGRTHSGWVEERLAELTAPALPEDLAETLRTPRMGEAVARIASGRRESQGAQLFRRLGERPFSGLAPGPGPGEVLLSEAAFPGAGRPAPFRVAATELEDRGVAVSAEGETLVLGSSRAAGGRGRAAAGGEVRAPLAGRLLSVRDEPGVPVESGEVVAVIESMKMHWEIRAPAAGRLRAPEASAGDTLPAGALILTIARRSTARFDASRPDTTEPPP